MLISDVIKLNVYPSFPIRSFASEREKKRMDKTEMWLVILLKSLYTKSVLKYDEMMQHIANTGIVKASTVFILLPLYFAEAQVKKYPPVKNIKIKENRVPIFVARVLLTPRKNKLSEKAKMEIRPMDTRSIPQATQTVRDDVEYFFPMGKKDIFFAKKAPVARIITESRSVLLPSVQNF